ncbi:MAG: MACPF domain-containing protein, partial [Alistipes sp.]|nr:MACPF domain-containing protein [Alistipes sp.]
APTTNLLPAMKKLSIPGAIALLLFSCTAPQEAEIPSGPDTREPYVYMERDPSYPLILSKPMGMPQTRAIGLDLEDYMGRSFRTTYFPFENVENIGYPVIDVKRIEADGLSWASAKKIRKSETRAFAYRDYDRYVDNSMIVSKIKSGYQINLGLFKIGKKKTMTEVFKTEFEQETNYVMGQLDVEIKDAIYELQINTNTLNQIRARYLHPDFKDNLYNLHPSEFFQTYGGFVLTNYFTGGRANALYAGRHTQVSSAQIMENDMTLDIAASFGFNSDDTTADFGFGGNFNNGKASSGKFSDMRTSIITQGGGYGHGAFTVPEATGSLNINLSPWGASMDDESTHTIIDIAEEGLLPLTEIVIERNLKDLFSGYYKEGVDKIGEYEEPVLLLDYYSYTERGYTTGTILVGLKTRTGDKYLLNFIGYIFPDQETFDSTLKDILRRYREIYKLKIIFEPNFSYTRELFRLTGVPYDSFEEEEMVKYIHPETNMMYLLHEGQKVGYSIYIKDDYLLDTYTIRDWVDSLPEKEIAMNELNSYYLIAL